MEVLLVRLMLGGFCAARYLERNDSQARAARERGSNVILSYMGAFARDFQGVFFLGGTVVVLFVSSEMLIGFLLLLISIFWLSSDLFLGGVVNWRSALRVTVRNWGDAVFLFFALGFWLGFLTLDPAALARLLGG